MPKRKHCDRAAEARQKQLYLIFVDWSGGYTIRHVNLPSGPSHLTAVSGEVAEQRLPPPAGDAWACQLFRVRLWRQHNRGASATSSER